MGRSGPFGIGGGRFGSAPTINATGLPVGTGLSSAGSMAPDETPASYLARTHERCSCVRHTHFSSPESMLTKAVRCSSRSPSVASQSALSISRSFTRLAWAVVVEPGGLEKRDSVLIGLETALDQ